MFFYRFLADGGFLWLAQAPLSREGFVLALAFLQHCASGVNEFVTSPLELAGLVGLSESQVLGALDQLTELGWLTVHQKPSRRCVIKISQDSSYLSHALAPGVPHSPRRGVLGSAKNLLSIGPGGVTQASGVRPVPAFGSRAKALSHTPATKKKEKGEGLLTPKKTAAKEEIKAKKSRSTPTTEKSRRVDAPANTSELGAFRAEALAKDKTLRTKAHAELKKFSLRKKDLNPDEEMLLHVLYVHAEPRKQLFWALKAFHRYPHLADFLKGVSSLAIHPR